MPRDLFDREVPQLAVYEGGGDVVVVSPSMAAGGVHDKSPERAALEPEAAFDKTAPSGREVVVRGFTLMGLEDDGQFKVRRYVDWAGVFTQMGLTLNWRTPVLADPPAF